MDCTTARRLIDLELDGELTPQDARTLEEHTSACADCRSERQLLLAVDRVLGEAPLERAPAGFDSAVMTEIIRRVEVRRRIDSVFVPAACGVASIAAGYGIYRVVNWEAARSFIRGIGDFATGAAAPLTEQLASAPTVATALPSEQGAFGAAMALAAAAIIFLGVTAARIVRQHEHAPFTRGQYHHG